MSTSIIETNKKTPPSDIIKSTIVKILDKKSIGRKQLIAECVLTYNLSADELKNSSSDSYLTKCKSYTGTIITEMISEHILNMDETQNISLALKKNTIEERDEIEKHIKLLIEKMPMTKKQIFEKSEEIFCKNSALKENKDRIHDTIGKILARLVIENTITKINGKYALIKSNYPNSEIGNCFSDSEKMSGNLITYFIKAINILGSEFFEQYSVKLLTKYFKDCQMKIDKSLVTGGPNDKGIDGIIEITDWLGYREKIFIQAKIKSSGTITETETRQFIGALTAEGGTRGIVITNAIVHKDAKKYFEKIDNLIAIDKEKLFELAKLCQFGIVTSNGKDVLDEKTFLTEV